MRKVMLVVLMFAALTALGCKREKPVVKDTGPLVPNAREREQLRAFRLTPESPKGQKKLHELRVTQKRIDEANAEVQSWIEAARKKEAEDAAEASGN